MISRDFLVQNYICDVELLIIDEIHLLEITRGHIIETIVERMLSLKYQIIALFTCLSNYIDVAAFYKYQNDLAIIFLLI